MPDAKRKPPVLYFDARELEMMRDGNDRRIWVMPEREPPRRDVDKDVRYIPAVPTCSTCPHFTKDWDEDLSDPWYYCPHIEHDDLPPQDGSGYCWLHPEAQRG